MACSNTASPFLLPLENITLSDNEVQQGFNFRIGTPPKVFSLRPRTSQSHISLYNASTCGNISLQNCAGLRGGLYDADGSTTYAMRTAQDWSGKIWPQSQKLPFSYFDDVLEIVGNITESDFPFALQPPVVGAQSFAGIGRNSTFIDMLVEKGSAPSRNWGLWTGSRSVTQPADGALYVGGYDSNRVDGDFTAFVSNNNCDTCTAVTNLTYITKSNSTTLFSDDPSSTTFLVELSPFFDAIAVPPDVFTYFQQVSGSVLNPDSSTTGLLSIPSSAELGDLSITFRGGYTTIIPAHELFNPPRNFSSDGTYSITNGSYFVPAITNRTRASSASLPWGLPFFAMNYLVLDFDWQVFKLAPAKQGSLDSSSIKLLCSTSTISSEPYQPTTNDSALQETSEGNTGAIAGGIFGGIIGATVLTLLVLIVLRRIRRRNQVENEKYQAVPTNTMFMLK